jgi:oligo-1,6-glucosidase/alpha-glucosidase
MAEPDSLLNFYRKVICLRNETRALNAGRLEIAHEFCTRKILAYYRIADGEKYLVLLNMSRRPVKTPLDNNVLLSTHTQGETAQLQPFEGRVMVTTRH